MCLVPGCTETHTAHICRRCNNRNSRHKSRDCPNPLYRCKACNDGCDEKHAHHYCRGCGDSDAEHRSSNCPSRVSVQPNSRSVGVSSSSFNSFSLSRSVGVSSSSSRSVGVYPITFVNNVVFILVCLSNVGSRVGRIDTFGGTVDGRESFVDAGVRELNEETGLRVSSSDMAKFYTSAAGTLECFLVVFGQPPRVTGGTHARNEIICNNTLRQRISSQDVLDVGNSPGFVWARLSTVINLVTADVGSSSFLANLRNVARRF